MKLKLEVRVERAKAQGWYVLYRLGSTGVWQVWQWYRLEEVARKLAAGIIRKGSLYRF